MILDYLDNLDTYKALVSNAAEIQRFIKEHEEAPVGRYELAEGNFVMIQEGDLKAQAEGKFESHEAYLDFQYVAAGEEVVEWTDIRKLKQTTRNTESDLIFYEGEGQLIPMAAGMFYLLYPEDGHKPCLTLGKPGSYRKFVFKLKIK